MTTAPAVALFDHRNEVKVVAKAGQLTFIDRVIGLFIVFVFRLENYLINNSNKQ